MRSNSHSLILTSSGSIPHLPFLPYLTPLLVNFHLFTQDLLETLRQELRGPRSLSFRHTPTRIPNLEEV